MTSPLGNSGIQLKSGPEKWIAGIVGVGLTALFGYGFFKILPYLVQMAQNTLVLGLYCAGIAALFYVLVLDSGLRTMAANFYKRFIRFCYILSFNVDPIGGLKEQITELRNRLKFAREKAQEMKGQSQATQSTIDQNNIVVDRGLKMMETARNANEPDRALAESIKVGAAKEANKPLLDLKNRIDRSFDQLQRIIKKGDLNVDVLDTVVTVKERSFKSAKAGRSALRAAMSALTGKGDKDDLFKMNMEWIDEYTAQAVGEMDAMLELNSDVIDSIDLQQMSYSDDAFKLLEARQSKVENLLVNDSRVQQLLAAPTDLQAPAKTVGSSDFSHIFNK
jgi:hypothetical protein